MRKSNYGLLETFQNILYLISTKLFYPTARLIRFPIYVRGKEYINFGNRLTTGRFCRLEVNGIHSEKILKFGENVNIGDSVRFSCIENIEVGNNVLIGSKVLIIDHSHGSYTGEVQDNPNVSPNERKLTSKKIHIGDNVWIGEGAVIQQGVTISKGAIVGANSVVTKDVSHNTIVGGVPARDLKIFNEESQKWEKVF